MQTDFSHLVTKARRSGWQVSRCNGGHLRFVPPETLPEAPIIFASGSPSDWRAARNLRAMLRRTGGFEARGI